jgi:hypothetical protein
MKTYYWESDNNDNRGQFQADTDQEAIEEMPKNTLILYKESDTVDGIPFIVVFYKYDVNKGK